MTWSVPSASMSASRACGSRQPLRRPNFACHSGVPGVRRPTSFLFQPGHPTSAALARSREAGTARPLMRSVSESVWKWNCVLTHVRTSAGTYSSQISGGSTMWLSQSKIGNVLVAAMSSSFAVVAEGYAGPRGESTRVRSARAQRLAVDLAGRGLRQRVDDLDRARVLVPRETGLHVRLQL